MGVDRSEARLRDALPFLIGGQIGDSTNGAFLRSLGIESFDVCFVAISGDFQSSLETTALLKDLGARQVVARAERDAQEKFLRGNGADHVIYPEKEMARWAAIRYTADHVFDFLEIDAEHAIFEIEVPQAWLGKSLADLEVRKKYGINVLGIKQNGRLELSLAPDSPLGKDVRLLVLGKRKALQRCFRL
jgi:trk system potassium uptake protein TrkA